MQLGLHITGRQMPCRRRGTLLDIDGIDERAATMEDRAEIPVLKLTVAQNPKDIAQRVRP